MLTSLSFKAEKKGKKQEKKREGDLQREKNPENCDTRTYDVIRQNFEKSSSHEINL